MANKKYLKTFLYFILLLCRRAEVLEADVTDLPKSLETLCPYTSFCGKNSSHSFQTSGAEIPCCQACSCDSNCGLKNNCCFNNFDIYNIEKTFQMTCMSSIAIGTVMRPYRLYYRVVTECFEAGSLTQLSTQIDKFDFQPVFSSTSGFIYLNEDIAKCNLVDNIIPLRKTVTCSSIQNYLSDADRLIHGLQPQTDCILQYLWPVGIDLTSELCEPNVIRRCNVSGIFNQSEPFWSFCEAFNATFIHETYSSVSWYGNIFCFLCNVQFEYIRNEHLETYLGKCSASEDLLGSVRLGELSITAVLDTESRSEATSTKIMSGTDGCSVNEIMLNSLSTSCRLVHCPSGKIRVGDTCTYYSKRWVGGPVALLFKLTPENADTKIPSSILDEMSDTEKNDRKAKWLQQKSMKRWTFLSLFHSSSDNETIDFIVVKVTYPSFSVNPSIIENAMKNALEETWQLNHKSLNIPLKVNLNNYTSYISLYESGFHPYHLLKPAEYQNELLYHISEFSSKELDSGIFLTKLFLCEQVDLLAEEFEQISEHDIYFKVKNITLTSTSFTRITALSNNNKEQESFRVCLSEFHQENNFALLKKSKFSPFYVFFIATYRLVSYII